MNWNIKVEEYEKILLWWYRKIAEMGHGDLTIKIEKSNNKIEIVPGPKIRHQEEQEVFEK